VSVAERLVVDASVVVKACLGQAGFEPLRGGSLVAPDLLWAEALSAIHELRWRGEIDAEAATRGLERLLDAPVEPARPPQLRREAWRVADELGWAKTYDAEYVALARILGVRLITVDARLARASARIITVLGPADL
jgi:predicted nucleic acid-binding protein